LIIVHHLDNSRSQRILWLLEELELPYEIAPHIRDPMTGLAPPSLKSVHPLGKAPVIVDGDLMLAESGAIGEYLLERYGEGRLAVAPGAPEHVRYLYWMHYAEGSAMQPLVLKVIFDQIETGRVPFFIRPIMRAIGRGVKAKLVTPEIDRHMSFLEAELGRSPWFAGEQFTAADILMSFPIQAAAARAGLDQRYPRLLGYLDRIESRPAYLRAIARGGPYAL
jgi:glutathione S-transferase